MRKIIASTTVAASLLGGGAAAIVLAPGMAGAQDEAPATEQVEPSDVGSGIAEVLDGLVADGTISQAQADAVAEALETARAEHRERFGARHGSRGPALGSVLEELGIEHETVREGLAEGLDLGEIAAANGSSAEALIDALVAQANERLDEAVEAGHVDAETADERRAEIEARVTDMVNGDFDPGERGRRGFRGHRGFGHGHDADASATSDVSNDLGA